MGDIAFRLCGDGGRVALAPYRPWWCILLGRPLRACLSLGLSKCRHRLCIVWWSFKAPGYIDGTSVWLQIHYVQDLSFQMFLLVHNRPLRCEECEGISSFPSHVLDNQLLSKKQSDSYFKNLGLKFLGTLLIFYNTNDFLISYSSLLSSPPSGRVPVAFWQLRTAARAFRGKVEAGGKVMATTLDLKSTLAYVYIPTYIRRYIHACNICFLEDKWDKERRFI